MSFWGLGFGERAFPVAVVASAVSLLCSSATADTIILHDGRVIEGRIILENAREIVIERTLLGNRVEQSVLRSEIKSIVRGEDDADGGGEREEADELSDEERRLLEEHYRETRGEARDLPTYLLVPLKGTFGTDIQAEGVEKLLRRAVDLGVKHVVFELDSPGGYVADAQLIADAMAEHDEALHYTTLIDSALSASLWVVLSSDRVFMKPGSTIGAAVAYAQNVETGAVQVDQKFISAMTARLRSMAERKGFNPAAVEAMIRMESPLYAWTENGRRVLSNLKPAEANAVYDTLDTETTVLTLTQQQAIELGLFEGYDRDAAALGEVLKVRTWRTDESGAEEMDKARKAFERLIERIKRTQAEIERRAERLPDAVQRAVADSPENKSFEVYPGGRRLTPKGKRDFRKACNDSLRSLAALLGEFRRIHEAVKVLDANGVPHGINVEAIERARESIVEEMDWLREHRHSDVLP